MEKQSNFASEADRPSLLVVRDKYEDVKNLMGELSQKLTKVSSHIEKEFLSAYRVHMLSVQEELRDLKDQVVKAEDALNDDNEVSALESEVQWFTEETARLRNQASAMKADIRHVLERTAALNEQRAYLGEQLKTTLKRTRITQADMELSVMGNEEAWRAMHEEGNDGITQHVMQQMQQPMANDDDGSGGDNANINNSIEQADNYSLGDGSESQAGYSQQQQGGGNYNPSGGNNNPQQQGWGSKRAVQKSYSTSKLPPLGGGGGMKGANPTHSSSSNNNKRMGGTLPLPPADDVLLKQSKSATELRGGGGAGGVIAELQALQGSRVQAELDLEDTIKAVFETIIDRKVKTVQANVSRTEPGKDKPGSHWDLSGAAGGITGLGLQHYSDNDRLAAITQFVARPDIFARVTAILSADLEL